MIIIVDGYNLLKQLYPNSKENLELHKKALFRKLGVYKKIKQGTIKEIIVVLDGGSLLHAIREIHHGVIVLEAGYKRSADDWIIEYVDRYKTQEITIVSMDRALCFTCEQHGAFSIGVFDFAHAVDQIIKNIVIQKEFIPTPASNTLKFAEANLETDIEISLPSVNIDHLMSDGALMYQQKKSDFTTKTPTKKTSSLSKQDRTLLKKLKKIY
jgi:predicted RNA-binding protein with PIN domain